MSQRRIPAQRSLAYTRWSLPAVGQGPVLKAEAARSERPAPAPLAEPWRRESLEEQLVANIRSGRFAAGISASELEAIVRDAAEEGREDGYAEGFAKGLQEAGIPILGTSVDAIDLAEDRGRFGPLLDELGFKAPPYATGQSVEEALTASEQVGFPLLVRPSYVLGGRAMEIVRDMDQLRRYITHAVDVSGKNPVLLDSYLSGAIEVEPQAAVAGGRRLVHDPHFHVLGEPSPPPPGPPIWPAVVVLVLFLCKGAVIDLRRLGISSLDRRVRADRYN